MGRCGPALNPSTTSSALVSAICHDQRSVAGQQRGGGGAYVEEAADGADHEAGLVEACDAHGGVAGGAADEVHAEELHIGHGEELFGVKDAISLATYMVVKTHKYPSLHSQGPGVGICLGASTCHRSTENPHGQRRPRVGAPIKCQLTLCFIWHFQEQQCNHRLSGHHHCQRPDICLVHSPPFRATYLPDSPSFAAQTGSLHSITSSILSALNRDNGDEGHEVSSSQSQISGKGWSTAGGLSRDRSRSSGFRALLVPASITTPQIQPHLLRATELRAGIVQPNVSMWHKGPHQALSKEEPRAVSQTRVWRAWQNG